MCSTRSARRSPWAPTRSASRSRREERALARIDEIIDGIYRISTTRSDGFGFQFNQFLSPAREHPGFVRALREKPFAYEGKLLGANSRSRPKPERERSARIKLPAPASLILCPARSAPRAAAGEAA